MDANINQTPPANDCDGFIKNAASVPIKQSTHAKKTQIGGRKSAEPKLTTLKEIVSREGKAFSILETLAQGGMGVIYKANDTQLNRTVAIKLINSDREIEQDTQARFQQEAQLASQLQHPNITTIHELGVTADDRLYIVMKYIHGETLRAILRRNIGENNSNLNRLLDIFLQVCRAMAYAHSNNIIHRDLKPENIMVGRFGEVQVMDWGLAKQLESRQRIDDASPERSRMELSIRDPFQTDAGYVMGTLSYMSPEQSLGNPTCAASDVYSLGVLLSEILTEKPTFVSNNDSEPPIDYVLKAQASWESRLSRSGQPIQLVNLANQCLNIENALRPRNASQIVEAIEAFQNFQSRNIRKLELKQERAIAKLEAERNRRKQTSRLSKIAIVLLACAVISTFMYFSERLSRRAEIVKRRMANFTRKIESELQINNAIFAAKGLIVQANLVDDQHVKLAKLNEALDSIQVVKESIHKSVKEEIRLKFDEAEVDVRSEIELTKKLIAFQRLEDQTKTKLIATIKKSELPGRALNFYNKPELLEELENTLNQFEIGTGFDQSDIQSTIANSSIKSELLSALELWRRLLIKQNKQKIHQAKIAWLTKLLNVVDLDVYRNRLRVAESESDRLTIVNLSKTPASITSLLSAQITSACLRAVNAKDELETFLLRAKKKFPNDFKLNHRLAAFYVKTQAAKPGTLQQLRVCHALQPENPAILFDLVYCLERIKKYDEAFDFALQLIELGPEFPETYNTLAVMMYHVGFREGAHLAVQQSILLKPTYADAHFNQGLLYDCDGEMWCALHAVSTALTLKPSSKHIETKVKFLTKIGMLNDAIALLRKAIANRPNFKFHKHLGELFAKTGDYHSAAECFKKAIDLSPSNNDTHIRLAKAYSKLGQPFEAEFVLSRIESSKLDEKTVLLFNEIVQQQNARPPMIRQASSSVEFENVRKRQ